jgi:hypothetical protein
MTKAEFDQYGTQRWYKNGRRHREDGPAVIYTDGTQFWYKEGILHREDGPAIIYSDGSKKWYINSYPFTKEEWWGRLSDEKKIKALFNGEGL